MTRSASLTRFWQVGAIAAVAAAGVGYLTGTREPPLRGPKPPRAVPIASGVVPHYSQLGAESCGPNAKLHATAFEALQRRGDVFAPVKQTEEDRERLLRDRTTRRAYDGAPPTIPHEIAQKGFPDCLACHEKGALIAGKRAPAMSHARYDACTQCHVPSTAPPLAEPKLVENTFTGLETPGRLPRPWEGAPPGIPHSTLMRTACESCHGVNGALGIRTTHPYRQSCTQCHTPGATLDQRVSFDTSLKGKDSR